MNYAQIRHYDTANGVGIRTTLFVSGCTHRCYNCFNAEYQSFAFGQPFTQQEIELIKRYLSEPMIDGLTILGGEPLQQDPREMCAFLEQIRRVSDKSIWIYSGYTYEEIIAEEEKKKILALCDVLVDGRYVESLKNLRLKFRGSANQRVIDIRETLRTGEIVELY